MRQNEQTSRGPMMRKARPSLPLLFLLLALAIPAMAKERAAVIAPTRGASVSGIVHNVDLPRVSILGGAVVLDLSEAKIVGPTGEEERPGSVRPGMRVHA